MLEVSAPAHADAGVPMLAVVWPLSWLLLIPVIAIEAAVAYRLLGNDWKKSFKVSAVANVLSTFVGIPLVWIIWLVFEFAFIAIFPKAGVGSARAANPLLTVITGAWLDPDYPFLDWAIPAATCFMLIPLYFASVWVEGVTARRYFQQADWDNVTRWAWRANLWSYTLLEIAGAVWLVWSVR